MFVIETRLLSRRNREPVGNWIQLRAFSFDSWQDAYNKVCHLKSIDGFGRDRRKNKTEYRIIERSKAK